MSEIRVNTISEKTSANGVSIDGVLIKDSKIGIGTTSPGAILEVVGPNARPASLAEVDTASTAKFTSDTSNADSLYIAEGDSGALIQVNDGASNSSTAKDLQLQPFGGNVGIGTINPTGNLEVRGASSNGQIYLGGSTAATYGKLYSDNDGTLIASADGGNNASSSSFRVEVDASERMRVHSSGMTELKVPDSANTLQLTPSGTNANGTINFNSPGSGGAILKVANTETMKIHSIGAVTKPLQPAFHVYPSSEQQNFNQGQNVAIAFGTERFDIGSNFASNTFTAPVTGKYHFDVSIRVKNMATEDSATYYYWSLVTSNRTYYHLSSVNELGSGSASFTFAGSVLADMDASDTASITIIMGGTSGSSPSDISVDSYWSGHLVC